MKKRLRGRETPRESRSFRKEAIYFLLKFFLFLTVLFFLELFQPVNQKVVIPFTGFLAKLTASLLPLFKIAAAPSGTLISMPQFTVDIQAGCNGIEPIIILLSAILAFPSPWLSKAYGIVLGTVLLQVVNVIRIVSLICIGVYYPRLFNEAHSYVWQVLIISFSLLIWMVWARGLKKIETVSS